MRINFVLNPDFESYREQLLETLQDFENRGEYVTKGKRNTIKKVILNDAVFNIKQFKKPSGFIGRYLLRKFQFISIAAGQLGHRPDISNYAGT